jgi:hypothetical protein
MPLLDYQELPGLLGPAPRTAPPAPRQAPEPEPPTFWQRLGALFSGMPDPSLTAAQNREAGRMGLAHAGLAMMATPGNFGEQLAAGAMAGQGAGDKLRAEAQAKRDAAELRDLIGSGQVDEPMLRQLLARAIATGNIDVARTLSEVLKSGVGSDAANRDQWSEMQVIDPATGKMITALLNKRTGEVRRTEYGAAPRLPSSMNSPFFGFSEERQLRNDYEKAIEDDLNAYKFVDAAIDASPLAARGDGPAQVQILYAFVKAMDPTSVVREGEVRLAQEAASLWEFAQGQYQKYLAGQAVAVPPAVIPKMVEIMRRMQVLKEQYMQGAYERIGVAAKAWNINTGSFYKPPNKYTNPKPGTTATPDPAEAEAAAISAAIDAAMQPGGGQ